MKYFIVFAFCATAAFAELTTDKTMVEKMRTDCLNEKKLERAWLTDRTKMDDVEKSCYMECLQKKMGMMKDDGTYDMEAMTSGPKASDIKMKTKDNLDMVMKTCKDKAGTDMCKMANCVGSMIEV